MSRNVGDIILQLKLDDKRYTGRLMMPAIKHPKRATSAFVGIGKAIVAGFSVVGVTKIDKILLGFRFNMAEVENVVDTVFGA